MLLTLNVDVDSRMFISDVSKHCVMMISKLQRQFQKRLFSNFRICYAGIDAI
jgi:hypothetical protein